MPQFTSVTAAKVTSVCSKHDETRLAFCEIVDEKGHNAQIPGRGEDERNGDLSPTVYGYTRPQCFSYCSKMKLSVMPAM
jgi:hypothetical protein